MKKLRNIAKVPLPAGKREMDEITREEDPMIVIPCDDRLFIVVLIP